MKFPKVNQLLQDKNVLYIVLFLAITNLLGYVFLGDTESVVFFLVVGFLTTYFSKNMIVILLVAMLATNFLVGTKHLNNIKEGMKNKGKKKDKKKKKKENMENEDNKDAADVPVAASEEEEEEVISGGGGENRVDYAKTLEQAYDNIQDVLGDGGMESLTAQSKELMTQQKQLMDNMKSAQPLLESAGKFLENFDLENMGGITDMLKKIPKQFKKEKKE